MTKPWEEFARGRGDPPSKDFNEWQSLSELTHGTHLTSASRIAEDGQIGASLIYDGKLHDTRTEVVYFTPNSWGNGTRYGAFEFRVKWETLLQGRTLYWVEAIKTYQIPIYRFLLTRRDVSSLAVRPYNPSSDLGPIRQVDGQWFWAPGNVAEIVIDEALPLPDVFGLNFVQHHDRLCSLKRGSSCAEAGWGKSWRAHAAFMGFLLSKGLVSLNEQLTDERGMPNMDAKGALMNLYIPLVRDPERGSGPVSQNKVARLILRAAALQLHAGFRTRAKNLSSLIDTQDRAERAFLTLIRKHFEAPTFDFS